MKGLARLLLLDIGRVVGGGRFLAFSLLLLLPTLAVLYAAGLFWIPQSAQNMMIYSALNPGRDIYGLLEKSFVDAVKGLVDIASGFWIGFPMLIIVSIVVSEYISGERASGTFDLLVTKPVRRWWLPLSKLILFLSTAIPVLVLVYFLNILTVSASFYSGLGVNYVFKAVWSSMKYVLYYAISTWLLIYASSGLTMFFSVWTKRSFLPVMLVFTYYIIISVTGGVLEGIVGGSIGKLISQVLVQADFTYHANIVMTKLVQGTLTSLSQGLLQPNYKVSLAILAIVPTILHTASLIVLEKRDLK